MMATVSYLGDYIDGQFVRVESEDGRIEIKSPADLAETVIDVPYAFSHVDRACEAAKKALREWSLVPMSSRVQKLQKLQSVFEENKSRIAEMISRETGKPTWEALTEVAAMINKIPITIDQAMRLVDEVIVENALPGVRGRVIYKPRGVMTVVGPFNFPGHLPNGHIVPALLTGNTVVFKPSEFTPGTGQIYAECIHKAGFPAGVFNLVQGTGESGRRLVEHELIDGILFTGSYETGLKIKQSTMNHYWKIHALEMGGKNATIVWEDADLEKAIYESLIGSFASAGQRCSCTSRIILHKSIYGTFLEKFYQAAKKLEVGYWKTNPFMGPLIHAKSLDTYLRFQEIAVREGCEKIMRGKQLDLDKKGYYVTPSIYSVKEINKNSVYQKNEIFGPNVAIYTATDLEEALQINNSTGFGLVTSIFSKSRKTYEEVVQQARSGLVNWNRTTNGASSKLPFGGRDKSGNDRPTSTFAVYYCTVPVACLEDETSFDAKNVLPGMNYQAGGK
jgi:succinylglutamic semialdehyde dehydrogenase